MTSDGPAEEQLPEPTEFDWSSPRWRETSEADEASDADQRRRRFRDQGAPAQRGAIDAKDSIPSRHDEQPTPETPAAD